MGRRRREAGILGRRFLFRHGSRDTSNLPMARIGRAPVGADNPDPVASGRHTRGESLSQVEECQEGCGEVEASEASASEQHEEVSHEPENG